jgi:hypothetical protein
VDEQFERVAVAVVAEPPDQVAVRGGAGGFQVPEPVGSG